MNSKNVKKTDIILAGVGGQGILSVAATIGEAAVRCNLYLKQAETHGMSQRGGEVQSHLRISENPIASDLIPRDGESPLPPIPKCRWVSHYQQQ